MLSSSMPEALRKEKNYYDVSGCGANIAWHTENDTIEIADRDILLKDMRIYLLSTLRVANAEILPFDWGATCDEFLATIEAYETQSKGLADLSTASAATQKLKGALVKFGASKGAAAPRNAVLQELSRILVPINYTREPRFRHDPAYTVPPLPTLAVAAELPGLSAEMRRFGEVELTRGLNRYIAAIDAATRLVEGTPV
jgi:N-acetylated-alpha-linked acidic dipeptidase